MLEMKGSLVLWSPVGVEGRINHSLINTTNAEALLHARHWASCREVSDELRHVSNTYNKCSL